MNTQSCKWHDPEICLTEEQDEEGRAVGDDTEKAYIALAVRSASIMAVEVRYCSVQQWGGSHTL